MKLVYYMVPHVCALSRKCGDYRPDSDMFQDLRVVFLDGFSTNSLLSTFGIYLLHERIYCHFFFTSSALGPDDTVGNFEVSNLKYMTASCITRKTR